MGRDRASAVRLYLRFRPGCTSSGGRRCARTYLCASSRREPRQRPGQTPRRRRRLPKPDVALPSFGTGPGHRREPSPTTGSSGWPHRCWLPEPGGGERPVEPQPCADPGPSGLSRIWAGPPATSPCQAGADEASTRFNLRPRPASADRARPPTPSTNSERHSVVSSVAV